MSKKLVGQHLLRVRIRKNIFDKLQLMADEEAARTGEHVTVSDIVRAACYNHLLIHESIKQIENAPPSLDEDDALDGIRLDTPMLK